MKIVKLESNNILKLDAVEIEPDGNTIVIGGDNGAGKTSVLDSITLALGGRQAKHSKPLKKGKKKGNISIDLGEYSVTRTFTENGGGSLTVTSKDGAKYPSPQAMLDKITGQLTFDPLAWCDMDGRQQLETLKNMVGLDFTDQDEKRERLFSERTVINRNGKELKARYDALPDYPEVPEKEVSVSELMEELGKRQGINSDRSLEKNAIDSIKYDISTLEQGVFERRDSVKEIEEQISVLERRLVDYETSIEKHQKLIDNKNLKLLVQEKKVESIKIADVQEIKDQIADAENVNVKVRSNLEKEQLNIDLEEKRKESQNLTDQITDIDAEKANALASASFPIDSLSFDESGVIYNSIPFSQASGAEKLRVSVAMGIAMNPKLKVLLIRDGSLLDEKNLKMIAEMAEKADSQVWIERVGKGEECQIIIEDGKIYTA